LLLAALRGLALVASWLLIPGLLQAAQYTDAEGFSLALPDTWAIAPKGETETLGQAPSPAAAGPPANAGQIALLASNSIPGHSDNVSVVVQSGSIRPDEQLARDVQKESLARLRSMGVNVATLRASVARVADRDVIALNWSGTFPGVNEPIRQWEIMFPGWRKTYLVTFTASEKDYADMAPVFQRMADSFDAPKGMPAWAGDIALGVMVAAGAALAVVAVVWLARRRKRHQALSGENTPGR
jgi:hypothetical protein